MRRLLVTSAVVLCPLQSFAQTATGTSAEDALTSDVRAEGEPAFDPLRLLLDLPQAFIELAFVPIMPIAVAFDRWHLAERLFDLLTNDEQTLAVVPVIDPFNSSGLGLGLTVVHNDPLGSQDRTVLVGLVRTNRDRSVSLSFRRRLPFLSGRVFGFGASYSVDRDTRYFGLGGEQDEASQRRLRTDAVNAATGIDLFRFLDFDVDMELAYRRRELSNGTFPGELGVADDDLLTPPPGFGAALDYPELTFRLNYDTRDSISRTTTGWIAQIETSATKDVNGGDTSGFRTTATVGTFFELLPLYRVLVLTVGASAAVPLDGDDDVPLHHMINLGGSNRLRGYVSDRFIDRLGWWATAEYRYYFFEYAATGYGLSATLFADAGRVGRNPSDLIEGPIAWSVGFGMRAEANLLLLGRFQVAISPDGLRFSVGVGEVF